jgi:predicted DNA-binding protein (MmcQ/YjbR family)
VNPLTIRPDRLERLRAICLALPEATEKEAWGDPSWRVRDRIFAMQKGNYEGGRPSLWLKAADGAQAMLVEADPERFFVPAYVGGKGWVGVYLDGEDMDGDWAMVRELVEESYRLIAPKRLAASLRATDEDRAPTPSSGRRGKRGTRDSSKAPRARR